MSPAAPDQFSPRGGCSIHCRQRYFIGCGSMERSSKRLDGFHHRSARAGGLTRTGQPSCSSRIHGHAWRATLPTGFYELGGSNGSTQKILGANSVSTLLAEGFGAANPLRDDHSRRHPFAPCPAWLHGETSQGP